MFFLSLLICLLFPIFCSHFLSLFFLFSLLFVRLLLISFYFSIGPLFLFSSFPSYIPVTKFCKFAFFSSFFLNPFTFISLTTKLYESPGSFITVGSCSLLANVKLFHLVDKYCRSNSRSIFGSQHSFHNYGSLFYS